MAVAQDPAHNFALISVPGDYAAAEAMKALRLGMDVMLFSDNVPPESELALKLYAQQHDLMVMGPDCGTAIVNGVPLGFANVIRRGPIGVVGASGTGTQEVTVRIHQLGSGVSQALGTGGHDLAAAIGGISMLHGLKALDEDPATNVIVLVSKPPAPEVAAGRPRARPKPARSRWSSSSSAPTPTRSRATGVHGAAYLAQAADMAVALAKGEKPERKPIALSERRAAKDQGSVAGHGAGPALRARHLLGRHVLLRGAADSRRGRHPGVLQRADRGQPQARERSGRVWKTRSSTWVTTSSPRAARTR